MKKNKLFKVLFISIILANSSCKSLYQPNRLTNQNFPEFSYEGHRGARGLYPENSIGAMKKAIDIDKVTTLEMDCHITKDKKVVVYHDHFLNDVFVQNMNGSPLSNQDKNNLIYNYTYDELKKFDIGSKTNTFFPEQENVKTEISLLSDLIDAAEKYAAEKRKTPMFYNIETKSSKGKDHEYHPRPDEFSDLILSIVFEKGIAERTVIQSFDKRTIQYIHKIYPQIKTSYLISAKNEKTVEELVEDLGYTPFIISPNYNIVTKDFVNDAHKLGIKVVPWTVNTKEEIEAIIETGVDGIISDYPNLF